MFRRKPHPDQFMLDWSKDAEIERIIEARVAIRAEADAVRWRLRLIAIETGMMAALVLTSGLALKQSTMLVVRAAGLVGGACLVSGLLLIALSGATSMLVSRFRRWRAR